MSLLQHVFQIGEEQAAVEAEFSRVACRDLLVRLGDADNLDVGRCSECWRKPSTWPWTMPAIATRSGAAPAEVCAWDGECE